jgi:3-carboxy-cis,cis-muconate cycloisomerase
MTSRLLDTLGTTDALAEVFSDRNLLTAMLRFEVALARAESRLGVIPVQAADDIAACSDVDAFDATTIAAGARASGTIAIGFVQALTALVRHRDATSAGFVHWAATSQDVTDTGLVLCLAEARPLLERHHGKLVKALRTLADDHAGSVMLGRTLLQPAPPVTFGLKAAGWYAACSRGWARVQVAFDEAVVLQFGGASGTLAALGDRGIEVATELGRELGLTVPDAPWHAQRDRLAALMAACAVYVGALGKVATDISLLMQGEVAEAAEPGGGSSTMPQKQNPAGCAAVLAAATRVPGLLASFLSGMAQQHERGVGGGHAEGPTVSALIQATGAALAALEHVAETLRVDPARMSANIDATGGAVFAERAMMLLARSMGRDTAHHLVRDAAAGAAAKGQDFADALAATPQVREALTAAEIASLTDPDTYLGVAEQLRRRLLGGT